MTVTKVWWTVINSSSNIRNSQNISFLSKCHILFGMYCDGLHKMVYKAIAYEKNFISKNVTQKIIKSEIWRLQMATVFARKMNFL